ncbi:hypothetical protein EDB83DRAFT_2214337 [Lactarius deliciosus]|nr:hypothetical protein EDB83DRAFT_2214337 [Lactarius deliciosus]
MAYGPYCSIVQSSGMGKSRLLDEFSKTHFLIPINLCRKEANGFPPPDDAIRNLLTQSDENGMLLFLVVLFQKTAKVITELTNVTSRSERITKFREFMADGQTVASVGAKRRSFYDEIANTMKTSDPSPNRGNVSKALKALKTSLGPQSCGSKVPDVFVAFDEAQLLGELKMPGTNRTFFHLRAALHELSDSSFFSFFLSTTSKIAHFVIPRDIDSSSRIFGEELNPSLPFSDLGFDHLMHDRKIFGKYKTIEDVTSTECVVHMGRPLQVMWGTLYDCSSEENRRNILKFAVTKLLCRSGGNTDSFSSDHECAVLSQRLALDFDHTAYITSGSTKKYDMASKVQLQISNFMRVCVAVPEDLVALHGVAASEPILSEAASLIMRDDSRFNLPNALLNVLDSYTISDGDQGELLVAVFFARARDMYAQGTRHEHFPHDPTRFCPIFSVKDLLSNLFHEEHFSTLLNSLPSVRRADFPLRKFGDVFGKTKMHFNHMIKALKQKIVTRPYLLSIMARGAASLGAKCQRGFDMVYPYLFDSSDLVVNKVGFIVIQVKNYANNLTPDDDLFKKMDPILCGLVSKDDGLGFTIPIIRIVFALGKGEPSFERMNYDSPTQGATTFDRNGRPQFTSYDFWCSGIGPGLLRPVDEGDTLTKWDTLGKLDKFDPLFSQSKAPDLRRTHYPAGGADKGHYGAWRMHDIPFDS